MSNPPEAFDELWAISCTSAKSCTAVGNDGNSTLAERWNGATWAVTSTPNP